MIHKWTHQGIWKSIKHNIWINSFGNDAFPTVMLAPGIPLRKLKQDLAKNVIETNIVNLQKSAIIESVRIIMSTWVVRSLVTWAQERNCLDNDNVGHQLNNNNKNDNNTINNVVLGSLEIINKRSSIMRIKLLGTSAYQFCVELHKSSTKIPQSKRNFTNV